MCFHRVNIPSILGDPKSRYEAKVEDEVALVFRPTDDPVNWEDGRTVEMSQTMIKDGQNSTRAKEVGGFSILTC